MMPATMKQAPYTTYYAPAVRTPKSGRQWIRRLHLILALAVGLFFVFEGLTGSMLVFYRNIDEWLNPYLLLVPEPEQHDTPLNYQALHEAVETHLEGTSYYPFTLFLPDHADSTIEIVLYTYGPTPSDKLVYLYQHPYTGEILGERVRGKYFISIVYDLHYKLMLGQPGRIFWGIIGIGILISLLSGLYLWWPRGKKKKWKTHFTVKHHPSRMRLYVDLHRVSGIYGLVILVAVVFSGVYMELNKQIAPIVEWFSPPAQPMPALREPLPDNTSAITTRLPVDVLLDKVQPFFPHARPVRIFPGLANQSWAVQYLTEEEPTRNHGFNVVSLNPYTGEILGTRSWDKASAGDAFKQWMFPLHNGEAFGLAGRWIIFVSGFIPALLMWTGTVWWWRRKHPQRHLHTE